MRSSGEYLGGTGQNVATPQCLHASRSVYFPQEGHFWYAVIIAPQR